MISTIGFQISSDCQTCGDFQKVGDAIRGDCSGLSTKLRLSMVLMLDRADLGVSAGEEVGDRANVEDEEEAQRGGEHEKRTTGYAMFGWAILAVTWRQQVSGGRQSWPSGRSAVIDRRAVHLRLISVAIRILFLEI